MKLIYSVEDNLEIREIITMAIESADMEIVCFEDSVSMFNALDNKKPDLVLLDIMLPGIDGEETLKIMKSRTELKTIPTIMVSAKGAEYEKVKLLNLGASDYITKPFGVLELIARVKANLKHQQVVTKQVGEWLIDFSEHKILRNNQDIHATEKEYLLLKLLLENKGKTMNKDIILERIWGEDYEVESRTLNMVVLRLRDKLGEDVIETVRGVGFKLN